jgi:two-component system, chemotaxis family, response regulator Rcp1
MHSDTQMRPIEILIIEDNPADIRLTREGLKEAKVVNRLHAVMDGKEALDFLHRRGAHRDAPRPDVIFLDLNLPGIDGHAVLSQVKDDPALRTIPIVVLTSSDAESDVVRSYEEHANCFITKPIDFAGFLRVVQAVENFWFTVVRLPGAA